MKKLLSIAFIIIIGYHIGNKSEMTGMFAYTHKHHLKLVKCESVNNWVLCYWK